VTQAGTGVDVMAGEARNGREMKEGFYFNPPI